MIKKARMINFRNINYAEYEFDTTSILAGKNNLGKSNSLNAIHWLITNKLLTDKYGDGESDIQSIIPNNSKRGEHTEVSIWLDSGVKFTKRLKRSYDRETGKAIKHDTEYLINDAKCSTQKEFYETLYREFNFIPVFTKLKIDEARLFVDPLYALLKLDYKELRNLLVAMGCTVSNEELYAAGFEDMRAYEKQYLGKWDVMKKNLQSQIKSLNSEINSLESQINMFSGVEDYDDCNLKKLQEQKQQLILDMNTLKTKGCSDIIESIENEISKLGLELEEKRNNKKLEIQAKINVLSLERKTIRDNVENKKIKASSSILEQIHNKKEELIELKNKLSDLRLESTNAKYYANKYKTEEENLLEKKNKLSTELGDILNEKHTEFICPVCGSPIDLHKEDTDKRISVISYEIQQLENQLVETDTALNKNTTIIEHNESKETELREQISGLENDIEELKYHQKTIEDSFNIDDKVAELDKQINELESDRININKFFEPENDAINKLIEKKNTTLAETQKAINQELEAINNELSKVDEEIKQEHIKSNDYDRKQELERTLDVVIKQSNDTEYLLSRLNQFIQAMIKNINDKAKAITGFNFVMLEQNLSNDGITECCYIVDDKGIPFKDINTARKTEIGIQFITKCKKVALGLGASENNLPILADRLEGIDDINKIGALTTDQLICTRVTMDEKLTIIKG
jgi:hypothetical protein